MRTILPLIAIAACACVPPQPGHAALDNPDRGFVTDATRTSMSAVQDAQWADKTSATRSVRLLSQRIIREETAVNGELKKLAEEQNFSLPTLPRVSQQDARTRLKNMHGAELDKAYVQHVVQRGQDMIAACQQELRDGRDPAVRQFATNWLPRLRQEIDWAHDAEHGQ